jgi:hypothetical protein
VLNSLAVTKISKKHDKHSALKLSPPILALVRDQGFYASRHLAATFTHAQCIASEIMTAAMDATPQQDDYTCSICLEVLTMPVVLSCTHRFCYSCLAQAAFHDDHCPLCKKTTDLDPSHYEIDPVLNKFLTAHFLRSSSPHASPASSKSTGGAEPAAMHTAAAPAADGEEAAKGPPTGEESSGGARKATAMKQALFATPPPPSPASVRLGAPKGAGAQTGGEAAQTGEATEGEAAGATRKRACVECHKAKSACEGDPCTRCRRLGKFCVTDERRKRRRPPSRPEDEVSTKETPKAMHAPVNPIFSMPAGLVSGACDFAAMRHLPGAHLPGAHLHPGASFPAAALPPPHPMMSGAFHAGAFPTLPMFHPGASHPTIGPPYGAAMPVRPPSMLHQPGMHFAQPAAAPFAQQRATHQPQPGTLSSRDTAEKPSDVLDAYLELTNTELAHMLNELDADTIPAIPA